MVLPHYNAIALERDPLTRQSGGGGGNGVTHCQLLAVLNQPGTLGSPRAFIKD